MHRRGRNLFINIETYTQYCCSHIIGVGITNPINLPRLEALSEPHYKMQKNKYRRTPIRAACFAQDKS